MRDPNERLYRIGSGFSKMLQMLNVDQVQNTNQNPTQHSHLHQPNQQRGKTATGFRPSPHKHDYQDDIESIPLTHSQHKSGSKLPDVKNKGLKRIMDNNLSADEISMMDNHDDYIDDPHQPKIVKIYKKAKFQ